MPRQPFTDAHEAEERRIRDAIKIEAFEKAADAFVVVDKTGTIVVVNSQAELLLGYHRSDLEGENIETLIPEDARVLHKENRLRYMEDPRNRPMGAGQQLFARCKDGNSVPVDISLNPLVTTDGRFFMAALRRRR